jgi:hypothetical protein
MSESTLNISALGITVGVSLDKVQNPLIASKFRALWRSAAEPLEPPDVAVDLLIGLDPARLAESDQTFRQAAANLSTRVTLAAIEQRKSELVMLHACAVALDDGRVVAFVGPSGRGKTTLVSRLARSFGYVTDETVGVTIDGRVLPYRKPLSVIEPGSTPGDKTQVSPSDLGLADLPGGQLQISAVVLMNRDPDHSAPAVVEEVTFVNAVVQLVPELSYLPMLERPLQRLASLIDQVGGIRRVTYGEASTVASLVPSLASSEPQTPSWSPLANGEFEQPGPGEFARIPPLDGIEADGALLLLHGSNVRVLTGVGPAIWSALARPSSFNAIVETVVDSLGAPSEGDPSSIVELALQEMIASGLIAEGRVR